MKNFLVIILLVILANFIFLSVGYGQGGVGIQAIVPETESNRNITPPNRTGIINPTTKENKFLLFFQKNQEAIGQPGSLETQTIYDRVASYCLMVLVMIGAAAVFLILIRLVDKNIIEKINDKKHEK